MKDNFEPITLPTIEMQTHKLRLRTQLLTSSHWKGGENHFMKRFALASLSLGVIVVAFVFLTQRMPSSTTAYAQEVAQNAIQAVKTLSPEEKDALGEKFQKQFQADAPALLEEAKNAKDLRVLSAEEFGMRPATSSTSSALDANKTIEVAKVLQYTNAKGVKTSLLLNNKNVPIAVMTNTTPAIDTTGGDVPPSRPKMETNPHAQ